MATDQLKVTGTVYLIGEPQQVSEKLTKRQLILTMGDKYVEYPAFEAVNDKCDLLDGLAVGQSVNAYFNLRGREWNGKYYTNLALWKVEDANATAPAPAKPTTQQAGSANKNAALRAQPAAQLIAGDDESDQLPF